MRRVLTTFVALSLAVPFTIQLRGRSSVALSEREEVLSLETNCKAKKRCNNNSKKRLTGKALS